MRDKSLHILLVEDSPTHTEVILAALRPDFGSATVTTAASLAEARRSIEAAPPDLLLLDLFLPDGRGTELLHAYREKRAFPIVLLTGHGDEQVAVESIKAGALDYLTKTPANLANLPYVINRTLREWRHIVDRRTAEESLRANEERFRRLFDNMMEAIAVDEIIYDDAGRPLDWVVTDINPAYERIFERSRDMVIGRRASELYGEDFERSTVLEIFERIHDGEQAARTELYLPYLDKHLQTSIFPLDSARFATLSQDITERKHAEDQRERLLAELDATLNAIADALIIYRPDGTIARMNPAAEELLTYSRKTRDREFPQRIAHLRVETEKGRDFPLARALKKVFRGEKLQGVVGVLRKEEGEPVWLSNSAAPIRTPDGTLIGAVGTATDITALRELQTQRDLYVHTISHDLRMPLTVIQGHAELLEYILQEAEVAAGKESLAGIRFGIQRMTMLLEDLVDSARSEGGNLSLNRQPLHLPGFIRQLQETSFRFLEQERLTVTVAPGLPLISADPGRIERVLHNLLTNAQKYSTPPAPIRLDIDHHDDRVRICVTDEGIGIEKEDLPFIFDRFYRVRGHNRPDKVGLGLHIVRMLVEAHGGTVSVESTPGAGSCFCILLPTIAIDDI